MAAASVGLAIVAFVAAGCGGRTGAEAYAPLWSPDGKTIAYIVDPAPAKGCPYGSCVGRYQLWLMRPNGTKAHRLARAMDAAWAPDGRTLALQRPDGNIWTIRADGTHLRRISSHDDDRAPTWSPDGRKLAFVTWSLGRGPLEINSRLYLVDADGSRPRKLARVDVRDAAWSPSGTAIAFTNIDGLNTITPDGRGLTTLYRSLIIGSFAWSPDGSRIALTLGAHIAVLDTDGHILVPQVSGIPGAAEYEGETMVTWSPNGRRLALASRTGEDLGIYLVDAAGRNWRQIADKGSEPAWSPDGRRLAYSSGGDIYLVTADGSGTRKLSRESSR